MWAWSASVNINRIVCQVCTSCTSHCSVSKNSMRPSTPLWQWGLEYGRFPRDFPGPSLQSLPYLLKNATWKGRLQRWFLRLPKTRKPYPPPRALSTPPSRIPEGETPAHTCTQRKSSGVLVEEKRVDKVRNSGSWLITFICIHDTKQKCSLAWDLNGSTIRKSILKTAKASWDKLAKELITLSSFFVRMPVIACLALS